MPHKMKRVMEEFKKRQLSSSSGPKVTSRKQAIAIGMSEDRRAHGKDALKQYVRRKK